MAVNVTGVDELNRALRDYQQRLSAGVDKALRLGAVMVQRKAMADIREPSLGKTVRRYTDGGTPYLHVASKAGDAPNTDTGGLIGSIDWVYYQQTKRAIVHVGKEYGYYLETVMNRPFLLPALNATASRLRANIQQAIREARK